MSQTTIGSCGHCGGAVTIPTLWGGVEPPIPTCKNCGSEAAVNGPVIPMKTWRGQSPTIFISDKTHPLETKS